MEDDSDWVTWYNQKVQWFNYVQVNNYYQMNIRKRKAVAVPATLLHIHKKRRYSKKKYWVAPIFQERKAHGFFRAVLPKLILEDLRYILSHYNYNYIRMSAIQFENLALLFGADIFKQHH